MIDHFNLPVRDLVAARAFYDRVLATLGKGVLATEDGAVGYGTRSWQFGLEQVAAPIPPLHLAFQAASRAQVDAFYEAACAAGATCNGAPGERPQYGAEYYACFVLDPDGHNTEAVFRG